MSSSKRAQVLAAACAATVVLSTGVSRATTIISSLADYEPRMERPTSTTSPFYPNDADDLSSIEDGSLGVGNIDTPSDATTLRIGGQARHRMSAAFFFQLPVLAPGESFATANLSFDSINPGSGTVPTHNGDLWAVGIYNDISTANDPDLTGQNPTVKSEPQGQGLATKIYYQGDGGSLPGLNTSVPQRKIADNFLSGQADFDGQAQEYASVASDQAGLADYLNDLYAAGDVAGQYLVIRISPDAQPSNSTSRFMVASADNADATLRPALTFTTVVPEPSAMALVGFGGLALMRRRVNR